MIALINILNPNLPSVIFYHSKKVIYGKKLGAAKNGAVVIGELTKLKKEHRIDIKRAELLVALSGPASFSGIRSELATVNALSFAYGKAAVILDESEIGELGDVPKAIFGKKPAKFILPSYSREPNITISKRSI